MEDCHKFIWLWERTEKSLGDDDIWKTLRRNPSNWFLLTVRKLHGNSRIETKPVHHDKSKHVWANQNFSLCKIDKKYSSCAKISIENHNCKWNVRVSIDWSTAKKIVKDHQKGFLQIFSES